MEFSDDNEKVVPPSIINIREDWENHFKKAINAISPDEKGWLDFNNKFDELEWNW